MRDLKLINENLNIMHNALEGLKTSIDNIEGNASRKAAIVAYNDLLKLFEFLDTLLS